MRFRRTAPAILILAVTLVLLVLGWASNAMFSGQMAAMEAGQYQRMRAILQSSLNGAEDRALARAELVASLPAVRSAFAARDRDRLLAECAAMFTVQHEKYGMDQAQFVTAENVSFLRLNNPAKFGEDLSAFRPIIVAVNQDQVVRKGMALGRSGPALVGVAPMFDDARKPVGVFEMGLDFAPVLDKLKADYGFEASFYVKERPLREIATGVNPQVLDEHNRVGEYLRFVSTNATLAKALVDGPDLARVNGDPVQFVREADGIVHGIVLASLRNAAGEALGIVAVSSDFSATRGAVGAARVKQLALGVLALVLLCGVVLVVIRGVLLRPLAALTHGFEQIGRAPAPAATGDEAIAADAPPLCDELQALAVQYRRLRDDAAGGTNR